MEAKFFSTLLYSYDFGSMAKIKSSQREQKQALKL